MDNMTDKILDGLTFKVSSIDNNYSVRYYGKNGGRALGVIRFTVNHKVDGRIPQVIPIITSMDLNELIGYIMGMNNLSANMGDYIVYLIRSHSTKIVKEQVPSFY